MRTHFHWMAACLGGLLLSQVPATEAGQSSSASPSSQGASIAARLLGTWRLVEVSEEEGARIIQSLIYGARPVGYLMYDSTGHVCVQLINTTRPRWKDADVPTPEETRSAIVGFGGYCGRYEIRADDGYLVHFPEADIVPNEIGQAFSPYLSYSEGTLTGRRSCSPSRYLASCVDV
jgi:Lipocalin-like domain